MQQEIRRSSEGGVEHHGVADRGVGENVACAQTKLRHAADCRGGTCRRIEPDGLAGGRERGMRQRQAKGFSDNLRGGRGAEKLTAPAWRRAGAATDFGGVLDGDLALGEAGADALHLACIFTVIGEERDAARNQNAG